jgi:hypothetical protein
MKTPWRFFFAAGSVGLLACSSAPAAVLFSQTITNPAVYDGAGASDRDARQQLADDVTLATSAVVTSVTWWGTFGSTDTPVLPVSFDLVFYADSGGLPDSGSILAFTSVQFATLADTGDDLNGDDIYVFQADVAPVQLAAGVKVWFSVLADTANDGDDDFLWRLDRHGNSARRFPMSNPFIASINSVPLFVLEGNLVPEPSSFALFGLGALGMTLHRRRK